MMFPAGSKTYSIPAGLEEHQIQYLGLVMDDNHSVSIMAIKNETKGAPKLLGVHQSCSSQAGSNVRIITQVV